MQVSCLIENTPFIQEDDRGDTASTRVCYVCAGLMFDKEFHVFAGGDGKATRDDRVRGKIYFAVLRGNNLTDDGVV